MKYKLIFMVFLFYSCTNTTFSGRVYDYDTEEPLMNVQIDSNGNKTNTDSTGCFSVKIKKNKASEIVLQKEGYNRKKIYRKPDSLGMFSKSNIKNNKIYLFNNENDF